MEAAKASRGSFVLAALATALAAGMIWAGIALAGGSSSSASTANTPASTPVAYMGDDVATAPQQQNGEDPSCPNMGGESGSDSGGSSSSDTGSSL